MELDCIHGYSLYYYTKVRFSKTVERANPEVQQRCRSIEKNEQCAIILIR